jgi:hypothetical protein
MQYQITLEHEIIGGMLVIVIGLVDMWIVSRQWYFPTTRWG